ncbi:CLUMA_CG011060, isoform A [Clunio marinus]|uniref:CLUMA_CG011060, isoform A n=1 Tax=Clunio marinus TaxID=568069 RepID=A0A1J1IBS5_9DIPT|nr:CLUMA_CG011060, isoform A [Clunio marinus]
MNRSKLLVATKSQSEMRDVATRICREYLSGAWKTISSEEIQVKRISLPTTNNDNSCGSITSKRTRKDSYHNQNLIEPTPCSVLLRIYGQTHGEHALETMLTESVVFTLLSERQLGPKLHGIFPGGRIEQYIPARALTTSELACNQISMKIAEKMSEIHSLDIPVSKEPDWLFLTLNRWLNNLDTIMKDVKNNNNMMESPEDLSVKLSQIDFRKEVQWLRIVIESEAYPVVFCHNDLQEGNILFREKNFLPNTSSYVSESGNDIRSLNDLSPMAISNSDVEKTQSIVDKACLRKRSLDESNNSIVNPNKIDDFEKENGNPELMIIDFEYCAYNYRAFDIANHFLEWTYDYTNEKFPYFYHIREKYPNANQMDKFLTVYLKGRSGDFTMEEEKKKLIEEISLFTLASHMFWGVWAIVNINQDIEFGYWNYANVRISEYFAAKERYLKLKPHKRDICDLQTRHGECVKN